MGRAKVVKYHNNRYCGDMSPQQCDMLEQIITLDKDGNNSYIPDFRHIIYDNLDSVVTDYIEAMDNYGVCSFDLPNPYGTMRNEQTLAVGYMFCAGSCIIGDSVGLGKTVESAGLINYANKIRRDNGAKPVKFLFLTEKNIAEQVRHQMVKFTGDYIQYLPSGGKKDVDKFIASNFYEQELEFSVVGTHALLTTDAFIYWLELCRTQGEGFPFDILFIDESSVLGGSKTQIVDGFKQIRKYFKNIYFLNATSFGSKLEVFYNQLNILDPSLLPTKKNFNAEYQIMNYTGMYPRPTGKYKNAEQFKELIGYRYFARTRRSKGAVMEDCDGGIILSDLSKAQKTLLSKTVLHRMVYDCPSYLDSSIEFNEENVPKLASLHSLLENECATANNVIIFVPYKESQAKLSEWLTSMGYSNRVLNGDITDNSVRQSYISGFKNNEYEILITNVQKGLNFGNCDYCIFYSYDPNPETMLQFEGRITREFDIIGKHVYILCSRGKEYKKLITNVKDKFLASTQFTNADYSVVLSILLGDDY